VLDRFRASFSGGKSIFVDFDKAVVVGDLHADLYSAKYIINRVKKVGNAIFLGDYADRGQFPVETYYEIFKLSEISNVILLRGNHEATNVFPHDLPYHIESYFGDMEVYLALKNLWEGLPLNSFSEDYFFVHGGIPTKGYEITTFDGMDIENPEPGIVEEFLWNDPWEKEENSVNYIRGCMYFFGKKTSRLFLEEFGFKCIIRSHQPTKILVAEQDGMVVTVGSCIQPYNLVQAGFLEIDFKESMKDGRDVVEKFGRLFSV
jgi:hypothetical protein